jgi:hypothetical protein
VTAGRGPGLDLTPYERRRWERLQSVAWLLDNAIPVPFTRFRIGLDPIIGLVPGIGDAIGALMAGWIVLEAVRLGVPPSVLSRMLLNIGIDTVLGAVPGVGDLFDFAWKSDAMNLTLVRRHLQEPARTRRSSRWLLLGVVTFVSLVAIGAIVGVAALVKYLAGRSPIF